MEARQDVEMIQTLEAIIDEHGMIRLLEDVQLPTSRRALITILEEPWSGHRSETSLLSEPALEQDWNRPEEDRAWAHLQPVQ